MRAVTLRADDLARRFGEVEAVAGASCELAAGEIVALVGPSGCGKTSLLQMLGLLDRPSAGRLWLGEIEPWSLTTAERARLRRERIGFVFQQHNLLGHLSARENVALPIWRATGARAAAFAKADALLERFGLTARASAPALRLSSGEAQRVAIARALSAGPDLVLADEPTGSLDSRSAASVLDALGEVSRTGATLLVATHDPNVAARASRTLVMHDGRL